jgi:hypothetical protein
MKEKTKNIAHNSGNFTYPRCPRSRCPEIPIPCAANICFFQADIPDAGRVICIQISVCGAVAFFD